VRILVDENMSSSRLAVGLRSAGHDVLLAMDAGLGSVNDARVLAWAVAENRAILTEG
jgi:predicted nuclease of predicted toxin-antitoxin system